MKKRQPPRVKIDLSLAAAIVENQGRILNRDGWVARSIRNSRSDNARPNSHAVPSCPPMMLQRIEVARQSIEKDKKRAKEQGREYHPVFSPIGFTERAIAVFEKLAYDANMEHVWQAVAALFDDGKRPPDTWAFADFCYQSVGIWEHSPKRTRSEHREYFEKIADDLMSVAGRIICEPEFGAIGSIGATVRSLEMVDDDMLEWLLDEMNANPIDDRYIKSHEDAVSFLRFSLSDVIPDLYHYAEWIAANARRIAAQPSIASRPYRKTAQRTFFVKHLSKWFRDKFDRPMHEVVAGVSSALFTEAVTADVVRKLVQSEPDVSSPFRRGKPPLRG